MKNTSEESFFKKKGFFIALYSTLGAVMVLALVITFTNMTAGPSASENETARSELEDSVSVNTDDVETIGQQEADRELSDEQAWWRSTPKPTQLPATTAPKPTADPAAPAVPVTPAPAPAEPQPPTSAVTPTPATEAPKDTATETEDGETADESEPNETAAFTPFAENDRMIWPVEGEVAMVFSMDKLIYDPTLDQFRTNDDLRIAAKEGTPVKACADGRVLEIGSNQVYGTYVTIDHGNGWVSSYGQLMDGVLVEQGEIVSAGQVIGGVGQPSYFGSLNGTHMNLRVTKDDEAIDPTVLLAAAEE